MKMEPQLNIIFLPYPTPGHMIPMVDSARLFARHGASSTIITTQANASTFQKAIDSDFESGYSIRIHVIPFPASQVGLPEGVENMKDGNSLEIMGKIGRGIHMLRDQIELLFHDLNADCLVTDMLYPWTVDSAEKLGIPRLYFYSSSYFSNCASYSVRIHRPHDGLESDTSKFLIPDLPHKTEMTALQLAEWIRTKNNSTAQFFDAVFESEKRSYGTVYNSFHDLENDYEEHYKNIMGIKVWSIGPVAAWINSTNKGQKHDHVEELEPKWLKWLNSKKIGSVLYVSFGSLTRLANAQVAEIAHGLENSGHDFIWVIRKRENDDDDNDGDSFLHDFEVRMRESNQGYIIWNWAPQLLILEHSSIGGIVTHCGWNSILESLSFGLPMITWPMFAEQFYNEKLLVDMLKISVAIGVKENKLWVSLGEEDVVKRDMITNAVKVLMGSGEESMEMRKRAKKLGDVGKRAIEEGGTSYNNLIQLIQELKSLKVSRELSKRKLEN
ncbi:hypothetical protein HN51_041592 [Arachis hypogaea]|nr:soyasapogenol B glucuronide galactosyltransferase-like [Arachis ipaensis]XP_020960618.1 soyasapogenol B glucuronide galactosyltransferase-like [Arachis ipaensis]XP_020960619.1 soyasapogenol B glucuronide galactosyltransferase-like [Arachis ipaensis]XP_025658922.1 soyasapogenol B glucuronide galactosyltransferase [Arachis hypogaea]XP_025658923.1 soyasapogenol B glucuronide galactosyltransferase [Arachis hypogaea]XP_025658924.1 soyasapogenol B glucuronide galactosyltransferase [Arachis hypoga